MLKKYYIVIFYVKNLLLIEKKHIFAKVNNLKPKNYETIEIPNCQYCILYLWML